MLAWLAFVAPIFTGKVHFPTDLAAAGSTPPAPAPAVTSNIVDSDSVFLVYPWHVALGRELRAGHFPLWDPTRFLGAPFAADLPVGAFYPPNWAYAFGNPAVVLTAIWAATLLASLLMTSWLLKVLGLHPVAAALGAIVWTFGGFMVAYGMFDAYLGSALWLPMALAGFELARRGAPRTGIPIAGLALALSVLAGHAQISIYVWLAAGLWQVVFIAGAALGARRSGRPAVVRALVSGVVATASAFVIAAGLAALAIVGALQYAGQIVRQKETLTSASLYRLTPRQLPTLLIPDYLGNPVDKNYFSFPGIHLETAFYAGILALPLAVAGFWHRNRRAVAAFAVLVAVGVLGAFATPLYRLFFALVPGFARTREVSRMRLLIDFGVAGLAALGLDAILDAAKAERGRAALRAAIVAGALAVVAIVVLATTRPGTPLPARYLTPRALRGMAIAVAGIAALIVIARVPARVWWAAVALVALAAGDLWLWGFPYHVFQPVRELPASAPIQHLASLPGARPRYVLTDPSNGYALFPNASESYDLYALNGYDAFIPSRFVQLLSHLDPPQPQLVPGALNNNIFPLRLGAAEPPLLDLLGVGSVVAHGTPPPGSSAYTTTMTYVGPITITPQAGAFPPAFLATCAVVATDSQVEAQIGSMDDAQLRTTALVAPGSGPVPAGPAGCAPGPAATMTRYSPQDVTMSLPPSAGGVVVLTDQWYPGWSVLVDGHPAPVLRVDLALRGVSVGPGSHDIEFRYQPSWLTEGLATTLLTIVVMGAWMASGRAARAARARVRSRAHRMAGFST